MIPSSVTTFPFTRTTPASIRLSASRLEHTPAFAMYLFKRISSSFCESFLPVFGLEKSLDLRSPQGFCPGLPVRSGRSVLSDPSSLGRRFPEGFSTGLLRLSGLPESSVFGLRSSQGFDGGLLRLSGLPESSVFGLRSSQDFVGGLLRLSGLPDLPVSSGFDLRDSAGLPLPPCPGLLFSILFSIKLPANPPA